MIAPLRQASSEPTPSQQRLRRARRRVAATFFQRRSLPGPSTPRVPAWRAWLLTAWVVTVVVLYFSSMLGLL